MRLFYLYIAALVAGGILLGASLFFGDTHSDVDGHVEGDLVGGSGLSVGDFWLPFVSLRFWVFFFFFGFAGTILSLANLGSRPVILAASAACGLVSGFAAAFVIRRLRHGETGRVPQAQAHRGAEGIVLLPVGRDSCGKIRVSLGGSETDFRARNADEGEIPIGARVLLIEIRANEAIVVRAPGAEDSCPKPKTENQSA